MTDAVQTDESDAVAASSDTTSWNKGELTGLAIGVGGIVVWLLSFMLFGAVGLIVPALFMVFLVFVLLVIISRG